MPYWPLLLSLGCAHRLPLGDTPITSAPPELEASVREQLELFDRQVGPGRVRLVEVTFGAHRRLGAFSPRGDRILLADDLTLSNVRSVLTHELCHALDFAEDLAVHPVSELDALAVDMFDPTRALAVLPDRGSKRFRRRETLAGWCGLGPVAAQLLAEPGAQEAPKIAAVARWLTERVWLGMGPVAAHLDPDPQVPARVR